MLKCTSCGGVYEPAQPGGVKYLHVCPPITRVHVERATLPMDVPITDLQPTDTIEVMRAGVKQKILANAVINGDQRLGDTLIERPNKRDENVTITGYDKTGNPITAMKSTGDGVTIV
jgi:hypothetical protein